MVPLLMLVASAIQAGRIAVAPAESLSVTDFGAGAPVVFIPGLFGSSYSYRHVMLLLDSAGYRSIGIEPLGMGSSSRPEGADYSLTAQADRVAAVLDTLSVTGAVLVGHSLGTSIAMRVAYRHPEMARGIVSIEGGPAEAAATDGFRRWMRLAPIIRMLDGRRMARRLIYRDMKKTAFDDSWVDDRIVSVYISGLVVDYRSTIRAYQEMARAKEPELLRDHLSEIVCPVVLLVSEAQHDYRPPLDEVTLLTERLTSFVMDTVPRSGYFIQEERPAAVADVVGEIFEDGACGGPGVTVSPVPR